MAAMKNKLTMSLDEISSLEKPKPTPTPAAQPSQQPAKPFAAQVTDSSARKIYIGNLPFRTSWQDLKDIFKQVGPVVHSKILLAPDGHSRGAGIIEFQSADSVEAAIRQYNGAELAGRSLLVKRDRPDPRLQGAARAAPGSAVGAAAGFGGGSGMKRKRGLGAPPAPPPITAAGGKRVFVGNLPFETSWQDLKDVFRTAGPVVRVEIMTTPDGRSKGAATVEFVNAAGAANAISRFNAAQINGRSIVVRMDRADPALAKKPRMTVTTQGVEGAQKPGVGAPGRTLYVGNISYETSWQELVRICAGFMRNTG